MLPFNTSSFDFKSILNDIYDWALGFLPNLLGAAIVLVAGWWLSGFLTRLVLKTLKRGKTEELVISFLKSLILCILRIIVIVTAVSQLGIDMSSIVTALGAAVVTVGLALKDSMSNIASGTLIIFNRPFKVGDYLQVDGLEGSVEKIEMMNTHLKTFDNKAVIIPNSRMTANSIINYSARNERRLDIKITVSYEDDLLAARHLLSSMIDAEKRILRDPMPFVGVEELQEDGVLIILKLWCSLDDYWDVYYSMNEKIKEELQRGVISHPYRRIDIAGE